MTLLQLIVIAVVQGVTEFLPISSSGHLYLTSRLLDWPDQGVLVDAAVHLGTLLAVLVYCRRDVGLLLGGFGDALRRRDTSGGRLLVCLVVATAPLIIIGAALAALDMTDIFRSIEIIAWATLGFGVLLWLADRYAPHSHTMAQMTVGRAAIIGLCQALALIPGASRAGVTMTAGRMLGFEPVAAARFSLLMSIPAILAAGGYSMLVIWRAGDMRFGLDIVIAAGVSFLVALPAISLMMAWLARAGFGPFVIYRLALGAVLLAVVYGGAPTPPG